MSERDYSQFGEQQAILAWAENQAEPGSFVDVGAYDGQTYSNTAALAEQGWTGLCIEPAPDAAALCVQHHAGSQVATLAAALSNGPTKLLPLYWTPGQPYSALRYEQARANTETIVPILVAGLHPSDLYELWQALPKPHFLSLDAEGSSLELFQTLNQWLEIACVCLEAHPGEERDRARELLAGWTLLAETEVNLVAVR